MICSVLCGPYRLAALAAQLRASGNPSYRCCCWYNTKCTQNIDITENRCCSIMVDTWTPTPWNGASYSGVLLNRACRFLLPSLNERKTKQLCFYSTLSFKTVCSIWDRYFSNCHKTGRCGQICISIKNFFFYTDPLLSEDVLFCDLHLFATSLLWYESIK